MYEHEKRIKEKNDRAVGKMPITWAVYPLRVCATYRKKKRTEIPPLGSKEN